MFFSFESFLYFLLFISNFILDIVRLVRPFDNPKEIKNLSH